MIINKLMYYISQLIDLQLLQESTLMFNKLYWNLNVSWFLEVFHCPERQVEAPQCR